MRILCIIQSIMITLVSLCATTPLSAQQEDAEYGERKSESVVNPNETVSGAIFTTAIEDDQPTQFLNEIENTAKTVYFFCRINGLEGQTVRHRWRHEGRVMADEKIPIRGEHVAVWSRQTMRPEWTGEWTVEVIDEQGQVLSTSALSYLAPL